MPEGCGSRWVESPTIRAFSPSSAPYFIFSSLGVFSWNCGRGSRPWPTPNARLGLLGAITDFGQSKLGNPLCVGQFVDNPFLVNPLWANSFWSMYERLKRVGPRRDHPTKNQENHQSKSLPPRALTGCLQHACKNEKIPPQARVSLRHQATAKVRAMSSATTVWTHPPVPELICAATHHDHTSNTHETHHLELG